MCSVAVCQAVERSFLPARYHFKPPLDTAAAHARYYPFTCYTLEISRFDDC